MNKTQQISKEIQEDYLNSYRKVGEKELYRNIITRAIQNLSTFPTPDEFVLDLSEAFLAVYRKNQMTEFLEINKVLRRAAHTINRTMRQKDAEKKKNKRFLNLV